MEEISEPVNWLLRSRFVDFIQEEAERQECSSEDIVERALRVYENYLYPPMDADEVHPACLHELD